jgi:hypothetical protein
MADGRSCRAIAPVSRRFADKNGDGRDEALAAASGFAVRRRAAGEPIVERSEQEPAEAERTTATKN